MASPGTVQERHARVMTDKEGRHVFSLLAQLDYFGEHTSSHGLGVVCNEDHYPVRTTASTADEIVPAAHVRSILRSSAGRN